MDFILGKIECFTSNQTNGFIDKTLKTFIFLTILSPEILVDFTLGKLGNFTINGFIDKTPKVLSSFTTLFREILVDLTLGKLGCFTINKISDKTLRRLFFQYLCLPKSWWTLH